MAPLPHFLLLLAALIAVAAAAATESITVHAWPLSAPSPTPLAQISYDPANATASLLSWTAPSFPSDSENALIRVGLRNPNSKDAWSGILTSAQAFGPGFQRTLVLHADREGKVYSVGLGAEASAGAGAGTGEEKVEVKVQKARLGPQPQLNKPVVLDETGKVKGQEQQEKTFLQKYWWIIALFLVMQVVAGGGKE